MALYERNKKYPCGSNLKYKLCCEKIVKENSIFDLMNKKEIDIDEAKLLKKILNTSTDIEKSFDSICSIDLIGTSRYHSLAMHNIINTLKYENNFDEITNLLIPILMNLTHSIASSLELMRRGYQLEPGLIFRNIIERVSVIIYSVFNPSEFEKISNDKFNSNKTISYSKKIIEVIGVSWGTLSKHIVHVGKLHKLPVKLQPFRKKNDAYLNVNLYCLKLSTWLFYVVSELVCFDYIKIKKYWIKDKNGMSFMPYENELFTAYCFIGHKFLSDNINIRKG